MDQSLVAQYLAEKIRGSTIVSAQYVPERGYTQVWLDVNSVVFALIIGDAVLVDWLECDL